MLDCIVYARPVRYVVYVYLRTSHSSFFGSGRNVLVSLFVRVSHFYIEFYPFSSHFLIVSVFVVYFPLYHRFGTRDLVMNPCALVNLH
jgi:hypothetical protein